MSFRRRWATGAPILPPGVVCDTCNNGSLANCDEALVTCPPIALLRTVRGIENKRGRIPGALFGEAGIYALGRPEAGNHVYLKVPETAVKAGDGSFELELSKPWGTKQASRAARSILKMALEMLAWDRGKAYVMDERFDGLRKAVLDGYRGWLIYNSVSEDTQNFEVTVRYPPHPIAGTTRWGMSGHVDVWGVGLGTTWPADQALLRRGVPDSPEARALRLVEFDRVPSTKRDVMRMTVTVTYAGRDEWDDEMPFAEEIRRIDGNLL